MSLINSLLYEDFLSVVFVCFNIFFLECDTCFQRISSLMVTVGTQSPVLLAILRTACCKALALLASKLPQLCRYVSTTVCMYVGACVHVRACVQLL